MHVVCMCLKIVGLTVAIILGLLLFLVLAGLFVPVRYQVRWNKGEDTESQTCVKLSWLFSFLYVKLEQREKTKYVVRVLGIPVKKKSDEDDDEKSKKAKKHRKRKSKAKNTTKKPLKQSKQKSKKKSKNAVGNKKSGAQSDKRKNTKQKVETRNQSGKSKKKTENQRQENISRDAGAYAGEPYAKQHSPKKINVTSSAGQIRNGKTDKIEPKKQTANKTHAKKKRSSVYRRCKAKIYSWKQFPNTVASKWKKWKQKKDQWLNQFTSGKEFLFGAENRAGFSLLWTMLQGIVKHCIPKKMKGTICFGLESPADTGKLLGVLGFLYGFFPQLPEIVPDFSGKRLEGNLYMKGRIRIGTVLYLFFRVWYHEDVGIVRKNYQKLKKSVGV